MVVARRVEPRCQHRACNRHDRHERSTFCIYAAIAAAQLEPTEWRGGGRIADYEPAMTVGQIAAALGITRRGVEVVLARALAKMREGLAEWRDHEPSADTGTRITLRTGAR